MTMTEIDERTERVKELGRKSGGLVVGVAAVEAFNDYVPEGHRPQDLLPGARSVVVAGAKGPTDAAWKSPNHRLMEVAGYDFRENVAVHVMADFIEREYGYYAIQGGALPTAGHHPLMSMMLAAVLSGLGTRSIAANIILNPKYGLLYYSALITTMPMRCDHTQEKDVCPHPMCVVSYRKLGKTPCMAACPKEDDGCLDATIDENGRIASSYYDRERCSSRSMNFGIPSFQKALVQIVTEDDSEKRQAMIYSDFFSRSTASMGFYKDSVAQCFECMRVCPVGREEKRLK
jgi:epoxyqueuosine reductase QueG